jgi:YegS/Rv2252/BmrU family lipid kinase
VNTCVIFNPAARGTKARRFGRHLAGLSAQCALKPTLAAGGGRALASDAVREGYEIIVAAGGDGTLNEVLNGIADTPGALSRVRLGVLPLGTVNVFAKELNLPMNFRAAWRVIERGREALIDLPEVEFSSHGRPERRCFAQMAGAGWDARAVELLDIEQKKRYGTLAYVVSGLKAMRGPLPQVVVTNGTETLTGEIVLIGNGRFYGGRYLVFPEADLRDGLLEVSVFAKANLGTVVRYGFGLLVARSLESARVARMRGETLELRSAAPAAFHVEGDNIGHLPARFTIRRRALRVIVP